MSGALDFQGSNQAHNSIDSTIGGTVTNIGGIGSPVNNSNVSLPILIGIAALTIAAVYFAVKQARK